MDKDNQVSENSMKCDSNLETETASQTSTETSKEVAPATEAKAETSVSSEKPVKTVGEEGLVLINEKRINSKITVKFYKNEKGKLIIGLDHFHFEEEEILITLESFLQISDVVHFLGFK